MEEMAQRLEVQKEGGSLTFGSPQPAPFGRHGELSFFV